MNYTRAAEDGLGHAAASKADRILVIRFKAIGDVQFAMPAVQALREQWPGATIDFLTRQMMVPLVECFPGIRHVIGLDRRAVGWNRPLRTVKTLAALVQRLRSDRYDLVVDLHGLGESAWLGRLSGAPHRWGSGPAAIRPLFTRFESTKAKPGTVLAPHEGGMREWHPIDWHLELLRRAGVRIPGRFDPLPLPAAADGMARAFLEGARLMAGPPILFIQPFSSTQAKDWPLERFLEIASRWRARGRAVVFGGAPDERSRLQAVVDAGHPVAAGLPLLATVALMKRCAVALGSDSGPLHVAHATGARVCLLRAQGNVDPWGHPERAVTATGKDPVRTIPADAADACVERVLMASANGVPDLAGNS